jgi:hypothetical protein
MAAIVWLQEDGDQSACLIESPVAICYGKNIDPALNGKDCSDGGFQRF